MVGGAHYCDKPIIMTEAVDFACPRCTSRYKVVRVRAEPELPHHLIHCTVCKEALAPTDGEYALKYFLVDKAKKHNGFDLRMNRSLGHPVNEYFSAFQFNSLGFPIAAAKHAIATLSQQVLARRTHRQEGK